MLPQSQVEVVVPIIGEEVPKVVVSVEGDLGVNPKLPHFPEVEVVRAEGLVIEEAVVVGVALRLVVVRLKLQNVRSVIGGTRASVGALTPSDATYVIVLGI